MQLSTRLLAVADMASGAVGLADIGTDHAYVPIYLAERGGLDHAVAMDVNRGPLMRAREHIRQHHLEDRIATRLSDGARELRPGEADTAVIAGMGGALTVRILAQGRENLRGVGALVLQPQSEVESVRRFLHREGYRIERENMVKDDGKYYPLMRAVPGAQEPWEDFEYRYGRHLIRQKNPVLREFLEREEDICLRLARSLAQRSGEHVRRRREQLDGDLALIQKAKCALNT